MVKRILVLVEDYPSEINSYPMAYVHTRNKLYLEYAENLHIDVLSFRAKKDYIWDGVHVFCEKNIKDKSLYSMIVSHAPNIKNHIRFILNNDLKNITFFLHGHEVLPVNKYYPKPYSWLKENTSYFRGVYDYFKLKILSYLFEKNKSYQFVFVSQWMKNEALLNLNLNELNNSFIIHNPINKVFIDNEFKFYEPKKYDFITIRPLDGSKYCMDVVYNLAKNNPQYKFKIIGKGMFFNHYPMLKNITWDDNFYSPKELLDYLNEAKIALMPTRLDAQGVMMCELAAYGMPIISSDINICHEMLGVYKNAYFINNENPQNDFTKIITEYNFSEVSLDNRRLLIEKFDIKNIINSELKVILRG